MPWKNYNPKIAMSSTYKDLSDWGTTIPTSDDVGWLLNPKHNWVYNKLLVAQSQNLACGPIGIEPKAYPIVVKPIINLAGGGVGAFVCHNYEQYKMLKDYAGYFWSEYLFGEHYSIDLMIIRGEIVFDISFIGEKLHFGLFDYWYLTNASKDTLNILQLWVSKYLSDYTGCLNVEVIDNTIIEAHLRFGDLDRLGDSELLEAIHVLYNAHKWVYNKKLPKEFYIAALFGQPTVEFNINPTLANYLFRELVYFQLDKSGVEPMGTPIKGKRLALFCDNNLEKVTAARNIAIALFTPCIDGKYVDPITNYIQLKI